MTVSAINLEEIHLDIVEFAYSLGMTVLVINLGEISDSLTGYNSQE
jgi:hypothetical protein